MRRGKPLRTSAATRTPTVANPKSKISATADLPAARQNPKSRAAIVALALAAMTLPARAQFTCPSATGPDVIVADLVVVKKWGTVSGITGYSIGSNSCNLGDAVLEWHPLTNRHPVIAQNLYRIKDGRIEQIGMSWLKHAFFALNQNFCCTCDDPETSELLGVGCSDVYDATLNGLQAGFDGQAGLGPRSEVNAVTGDFLFPYGSQGEAGNAVYKRLQVHNDDVDPDLNEGATYIAEIQYIAPDDAAAGNDNNNASFMPVRRNGFNNGGWELLFDGPPEPMRPAIEAWADYVPGVTLSTVDVPGDGRFIVGSRAAQNGDGTWQYDYAIFNLNSHLAAGSFSVPVIAGASVSTIGFHDVDYHSGEPFNGTDWPGAFTKDTAVSWATDTFDIDPNANALRWGTMYSFRFKSSAPPGDTNATLGLFRPGGATSASVPVTGPVDDVPVPPAPTNGADIAITGLIAGDRLGMSVSGAGNVNGDNFADIVVGAYQNDAFANNAGRTEIYTGANLASTDSFTGEFAGDNFGRVVLGECDLNDDGFDDIVVAAPFNDFAGANSGRVYAISGADGNTLWIRNGQAANDRFGWSLACAGDANGDGVDDVIIGAPYNDIGGSNAGRAYLCAGQDGSIIHIFGGGKANDQFGWAVAGVGDVNDDSFQDVAVGAPLNDTTGNNAGRVYIYSGLTGASLKKFNGAAAGDRYGFALAGRAWPDGLGGSFAVLAVGAPYNDGAGLDAGRVVVYSGNDCATLCRERTFAGAAAGDLFGWSVALGDFSHDALPDALVGAPKADAAGANSGSAFVRSAVNGALLRRVDGEAAGDQFGTSVAACGDVNGDGEDDLLIGAPLNDAGGTNAGRAYLFLSSALAAEAAAPGGAPAPGASAGRADINRDGIVDGRDVAALLAAWGECHSRRLCSADLNRDGHVDSADLMIVLTHAR